jgi:host factor-I protein
MSQSPNTKTPAGLSNIQEVFLNYVRREAVLVTIHLLGGRSFEARIKSFDKFAIIVEINGVDQLIFKHSISVIDSQRLVANCPSTDQP